MSTTLKLRRGTTTQHSSFTGAAGEVTVDTDKKTLVVHDGATAGGFPVASAVNPSFSGDASFLANGSFAGNLTLNNGNADGAQLSLASSGYSNWNIDNYSGRLRAYYGSTEYATIDASGNVGIGTSSPSYRLDLQTPNGTPCRVRWIHDGVDDWSWQVPVGGGFAMLNGSTERLRVDGSGNLKFDSGYGSVATAYGCRAWVNFNGTGTVSIRASGNVSSITDNGTGDYTINFTNAMPDANYGFATHGIDITINTTMESWGVGPNFSQTSSSLRLEHSAATTRIDSATNCVTIFR